MIKTNKRGQFYLIAGIIIAGIIIGFAVLNNSSFSNSPTELKEMVEELQIEGQKVLDYDVVHSTNNFEEDFSKEYSIYAGKDKEIYFIVGDEVSGFEAYRYEGTEKKDLTLEYLTVDDKLTFSLYGTSYEFKKEKGKNFHFILAKRSGGENYVFLG